jgi:7-cyano-7-deazaguanine synthase
MKVIGIVSGGLDSISYISQYLQDFNEIEVLTFNYGQKATKEMQAVKDILGSKVKAIKQIDISFMKDLWKGTQLTDSSVKVEDGYNTSVVVPIRNAVFSTIGVAYGMSNDADRIVLGCHTGDSTMFNGDYMYPDCDSRFHKSLETSLQLGHLKNAKKVEIWSPNREGWSKVDLVKKGYEALGDEIFNTWSCYLNEEKQCGKCESCNNRQDAFKAAGIVDKTDYKIKQGRLF